MLNDELNNVDIREPKTKETILVLADVDNWSMFSRYSLHDMFKVCNGSNVTLFAIISIIIRYGQTLLTLDQKSVALQIFPIAIQVFVSSRSNANFSPDDSNKLSANNEILCQNSNEGIEFIETVNFLVKESSMNVSRKLLKQDLLFGMVEEQLENILPSISGFLLASHNPGTALFINYKLIVKLTKYKLRIPQSEFG